MEEILDRGMEQLSRYYALEELPPRQMKFWDELTKQIVSRRAEWDDVEDSADVRGDVEHPSHYNSHPSGVEAIEVARHLSFNVGNVFKYVFRGWNGLKDDAITDLSKAEWYILDELTRRSKGGEFEGKFDEVVAAEGGSLLGHLLDHLRAYDETEELMFLELARGFINQRKKELLQSHT